MSACVRIAIASILASLFALALGPVTLAQAETVDRQGSVTYLDLTPSDLTTLSEAARITSEPTLPEGTTALRVDTETGAVTPVGADHQPVAGVSARGILDTAWKYTTCVAAVTAAFVPVGKAYTAIKALGGVVETARLLLAAGSASDFGAIAGGAAVEILGISTIRTQCF